LKNFDIFATIKQSNEAAVRVPRNNYLIGLLAKIFDARPTAALPDR
jgi:hypothetical protein